MADWLIEESRQRKAALAADRAEQARWREVHFRDNRATETRSSALGSGDCWCGSPYDHDWPGRAEGTPHPRQLTTVNPRS